jgi:hypothetical protein
MLGCHIYILFEKPLYIFIRKEGGNFALIFGTSKIIIIVSCREKRENFGIYPLYNCATRNIVIKEFCGVHF